MWWHVYPLGFVGAEPAAIDGPPVHRLRRLLNWLDYAVELGASGLMLGPVFASETHGYDTVDHFRIDPRLGDDADFDALVAAAHERGLKILLDGVFNHVGRSFPTTSWLRGSTFEGHHGLVELDHDQPAVADHVVEVCNHWLDRGADGWRLDAAYAVPRTFWAEVVPRVKAAHPDAYVVGEVIHGDYAGFVAETGVDAVTQYELWKAIWSSLNDRNLFELSWALERHAELLETFVPLTFVGNHDVTRIASRLTDSRHLAHALVVLFTLGGTPSVYAGDEQAFRGVKEERVGGDDEIRPEFPDTPDGLAPFGWPTYRLHQRLIALRGRHPWLHRARPHALELANEHIRYAVRNGDDALVVALNLGDRPVALPGADRVLEGDGVADGELAPHGWAVLSG